MLDSGQIFTFFQMEIDKKNNLIKAITDNANRYMGIDIHVSGSEHSSASVVRK